MANLIPSQLRSITEQARMDVFDSFSRKIVVFVTADKVTLDTDLNYNFSYDSPDYGTDNQNNVVQYIVNSGSFDACILYENRLDRFYSNPDGSRDEKFRLTYDGGNVRIKLKKEDYNNYIKDAINFSFDGYNFELDKTPRPHGLYTNQIYSLYLKFKN